MTKNKIGAAVALTLAAMTSPAWADTGPDTAPDTDARIEALQQAITSMQAQIDALKAEQQRSKLAFLAELDRLHFQGREDDTELDARVRSY